MTLKRLISTFYTKRPLVANCLTYGSLYLGAEFSQQYITKKIMVSGGGNCYNCNTTKVFPFSQNLLKTSTSPHWAVML